MPVVQTSFAFTQKLLFSRMTFSYYSNGTYFKVSVQRKKWVGCSNQLKPCVTVTGKFGNITEMLQQCIRLSLRCCYYQEAYQRLVLSNSGKNNFDSICISGFFFILFDSIQFVVNTSGQQSMHHAFYMSTTEYI